MRHGGAMVHKGDNAFFSKHALPVSIFVCVCWSRQKDFEQKDCAPDCALGDGGDVSLLGHFHFPFGNSNW